MAKETPLYQKLYADLRSKIQTGVWRAGELIPAESELMKTTKLSRITVRAALDQLVQDGLIDRFAGRGSFVREARPETKNCLTSFTDQMLSLGRVPSTKLVRLEQLENRDEYLPFSTGERLVVIERLRKVDDQAAALMRSYLPAARVPGIEPTQFQETGREQSLLYILEHHFGIVLDEGEETLAAICVNAQDAALLNVAEGVALMQRTCLVRTLGGEPIIYETSLWSLPQTQLVQRRLNSAS